MSTAERWPLQVEDYLRDECHKISKRVWKDAADIGLTLFLRRAGFYVAYHDDAEIVRKEADDERPMEYAVSRRVPVAVIKPMHIDSWLEHFAEICLPVHVLGEMFLTDE